ncbi:MAG: hypothetical protein HRT45_08030 [Bdellovibrionales bacterium]|nr:hypothetical protein [Bdellovibrionales bacterium]
MRIWIVITLILPFSAWAQGYDPSGCSGNIECSAERVIGTDNRVKPRIVQPAASAVMVSCGSMIPANQAYDVQIDGVTCGEGVVNHPRFPHPVEKNVMDEWGVYSRVGGDRARRAMQDIRQYEIEWSCEIEYPMYEHWRWDEKVGDFENRCGQ